MLDSFQGLSNERLLSHEQHRVDGFRRFGDWTDEVLLKFSHLTNMVIIPGFIPDTLPQVTSDKFCFVSIDLNCVAPEVDALKFTWDKIVSGGIVVFDDYGFPGHEEQKSAHDQFARERDCLIYGCPTGQGILIKP